eukprot:2451968-Prorocentrum_lima.AAC.1
MKKEASLKRKQLAQTWKKIEVGMDIACGREGRSLDICYPISCDQQCRPRGKLALKDGTWSWPEG